MWSFRSTAPKLSGNTTATGKTPKLNSQRIRVEHMCL
jgi:hypothetical protein